ncbi:GNAT family N-acetyltransferase [Tianweitania sp. BSSL-BM11]|uniref:GNAT family N-acetyltransferase n=1 Tax=Tianweitania aestuarii TaxID=2814886 RepID=A0ABS5RUQ3_9HYPH|nr:GNAT family N-acetyltransferase [Tianweitania aestuarii]MBS9720774.1 GNAT family N-acetyltransferase [Tianweitania aestuarii]
MTSASTELPTLAGAIRQLRPSDRCRFKEHLLRLDAESRHDRFNGGTSDGFVAAYADRCFRDGATVVAYVEDDQVLGAAELHERPEFDIPTAEIAFSVERSLQHHGIGRRLFRRIIGHAQALGYLQLKVTTHPGNVAMRRLARSFGATLRFMDGETTGTVILAPVEEGTMPIVLASQFNDRIARQSA